MEKILLLSNQVNIEKIDFKEYKKIITFDQKSSEILKKNNIIHMVSDDFLDNYDFDEIQNNAYIFANLIKKINLQYKNVNLTHLLYIEFYMIVLPKLKIIREIQKICDIHKKSIFHSTKNLENYLDLISINHNTINEDIYDEKLYYDDLGIEIGRFSFSLSKKKFLLLKNYLDKIFKIFLIRENKIPVEILFIEFNTVRYEKIFQNLSKITSLGFYGFKRPSIWNYTSLKIIKENNVKILDNKIQNKNELINEYNKIYSKINNFLIFKNLKIDFEFFGLKINLIIFEIIIRLFKNRLMGLLENIETLSLNLEKIKPKLVLLNNESGVSENIFLQLNSKLKIKAVLVQHGLFNDDKKAHDYNLFTGSVMKNSTDFLIWGDAMERYCKKYNFPLQQVHKVGSIIHDNFSEENKKGNYILVIAQGPSVNFNINDLSNSAIEEYEKIIHEICRVSKKLNQKIIIKLHSYEKDNNEKIISKKFSNVSVVKGDSATSYIKNSKFVISLGSSTSTAILESHMLNKPVIRINYGEWFGKVDSIRKQSAYNIDIENLESIIIKMNEKKTIEHILEIGKIFLEDYLSYQNNSSLKIKELIIKFLKTN